MNIIKFVANELIVAGLLGVAFSRFSYTRETQIATDGQIGLAETEKHIVKIPIWTGIGTIALGGILLFLGKQES